MKIDMLYSHRSARLCGPGFCGYGIPFPENYEVAEKDSELRFGQAGIDVWQDGRRFLLVNK